MKIKYLKQKYTRKNAHQIRHYKQKINELKEAAMEPISNEAKRQKELKKMKRVSVTCGTTSNSLTFVYLEFQKRSGEEVRYKKIHGVKFPKINGNYTYTD